MDIPKGLDQMKRRKDGAVQFLKEDIWKIRQRDLPPRKSILIRALRVTILSVRGIAKDRVTLRASALTFYSLLSIVPVMAMVFGIAKGFGLEKAIEESLVRALEGQEQVAAQIIDFTRSLLKDVKGGVVAGAGLLILFYTIIKILSNIENAFNDIWGIKKPRSFGRKLTDYFSMLLIGTVLFILSSSATVAISTGINLILKKVTFLQFFGPGIAILLDLLPLVALWVLFALMYVFIPNTQVNLRSGVLAGVIGGTLYHLFQWLYISLQIGVAKHNAIYGSFAALPLFFVWMQTSWIIVLFGAEISFAHQNEETFEFEEECLTVSHRFKQLLILRVANLLVSRFTAGEKALDSGQISHKLGIPLRLVNDILFQLVASGIASEISSDQAKRVAYEPARDPQMLSIKYVLDAIEERGSDNIPVAQSEELSNLIKSMQQFSEMIQRADANRLLRDI